MLHNDYLSLSARTAAQFENGMTMNSRQTDLLHATAGMVTEAGEILEVITSSWMHDSPINSVHLCEEIGDYVWYLAMALRTTDSSFDHVSTLLQDFPVNSHAKNPYAKRMLCAMRLSSCTAECLDAIKKKLMYSKPVNYDAFALMLSEQYTYINTLATLEGTDLPTIMAANIAKLQARYPDKFTNDNAINRDVEAEKAAMKLAEDITCA